ncbi:MAG: hypothetical protein P1U42_11530 [Phycisphaerales bacterium]|nr:hypothetical protein [Phycisphaerales bacterium]
MNTQIKKNQSVFRVLNRVVIGLCIAVGVVSSSHSLAQEDVATLQSAQIVSIPAARQAERIAVITVEGGIDRITAMSMKRRIRAAEVAGMDAMVIEINSPGGELGAVLEISNEIKNSSISNTVSWVHPDAYSGGAIIALACNEIVTSSPASMGDAFIIQIGPGQIRGLSPDERTKFLPPLMADVTDSARRSGFDEYLVQAIVVDGVELWLVEDNESGQRLAINEEEYRLLFDGDPIRGKPMLAEVTGGIQTYTTPDDDTDDPEEVNDDPQSDSVAETLEEADARAYKPASKTLHDVEDVFNDPEEMVELEYPSNRVVLSAGDKGKYRFVGYITDGSAAIVMRDDQLRYFGFSSQIINNDEELKAFFGASELVRIRMNPTEKLVRFFVNPYVRGFLIVVVLISLFVELIMGGAGIGGSVAIGALVLLLGPPAMIGLSGWWELIAIVVGISCLAIEAFVVPGFGVFGVIGFVALFGGLIGTFVSAGGTLSNPSMQQDLMTGAVTVLLSFVTAGIGWWLIVRNAQNLPYFERLILSGASGVGGMPQKSMLHAIVTDDGSVRVGSEGVTITPLYPIGQADFEDQIVDVHAALGSIDRGVRVRVISATKLRIEVEEVGSEDV